MTNEFRGKQINEVIEFMLMRYNREDLEQYLYDKEYDILWGMSSETFQAIYDKMLKDKYDYMSYMEGQSWVKL